MIFGSMGVATTAGFARRLATGYQAGADLLMLLRAEAKGGSARHRHAMLAVIEGVKEGETLSSMMERQDGYFPKLLVSMVRVGELTGRLERTMQMVADHYDHRLSIRRTFLIGIAWPMIQMVAGIFVIALLIWIQGVLTPAGGGQMLDVAGLGLRGTSGAIIFLASAAVFFALIAAGIFAARRNFLGVHNLIPLLYLIPVFGPSLQTITLSRFCWVLSLTLDTGLDAIRSVALALDSTDSEYYCGGIKPTTNAIRRGESLADSLRAAEVLPEDFLVQLEVAEISGTDAESLQALAVQYDERAKLAIRTLCGIFTAVVWIAVVLLMLAMMFSMLMQINEARSDALSPI